MVAKVPPVWQAWECVIGHKAEATQGKKCRRVLSACELYYQPERLGLEGCVQILTGWRYLGL